MPTAAALQALVVQYLKPGLLIAKITKRSRRHHVLLGGTHGERPGARPTRPVPASTSVSRLAIATVGVGSRLGRKNRAKAENTNGTSNDGENDGAHML